MHCPDFPAKPIYLCGWLVSGILRMQVAENLLLLTLPAFRTSKDVRMIIILCRLLDTLAKVSYR